MHRRLGHAEHIGVSGHRALPFLCLLLLHALGDFLVELLDAFRNGFRHLCHVRWLVGGAAAGVVVVVVMVKMLRDSDHLVVLSHYVVVLFSVAKLLRS